MGPLLSGVEEGIRILRVKLKGLSDVRPSHGARRELKLILRLLLELPHEERGCNGQEKEGVQNPTGHSHRPFCLSRESWREASQREREQSRVYVEKGCHAPMEFDSGSPRLTASPIRLDISRTLVAWPR